MANQDFLMELDNISVASAHYCDIQTCNSLNKSFVSSLNIFSLNIRSIYKNLESLLAQIATFSFSTDIIILTECWLVEHKPIPSIENYVTHFSRYCKNQNDGIVVYLHKNISCTVIEPNEDGGTFLLLKLDQDIYILAVYRSPSEQKIDSFLNAIENIIRPINSAKNIILIGDVNIDIKPSNLDNKSAPYLNLTAELGILPGHTYPTRMLNCLDHIMIKSIFPASIFVLDCLLTDHCSVLLNLRLAKALTAKCNVVTKINFEAAVKYLESIDFSFITSISDANEAASKFVEILSSSIKLNSNLYVVPSRRRILKPWLTPGVLRCIRHRDRLHKRLKTDPNNIILEISFKRYRNYCNSLIKKLKRNYDKTLLQSAKTNKDKWNAIKTIIDYNKIKTAATDLLNSANDAKQEIELINEYFSKIGKQLADAVSASTNLNSNMVKFDTISSPNSMVLLPPDEAEVELLINNLKNNCATGWDSIPVKLLKEARHIIVPPLTKLFDACVVQGIFPRVFKRSLITPVHKSGTRNDVTNYRPISVLTSLSKVFEKMLNKRLINFLEYNDILSSCQFGFRAGKSTEDAVNQLIDYVTDQLDAKQKCVGVFLDLAKAFDTVSIPMLVNKLYHIGVRGGALMIFRDFLCGRTQQVKIGEHLSTDTSVLFGVPQGSVLGPSLFIIYINDLCHQSLNNGKIFTFADDTALVFHGGTWNEACRNAEIGLQKVSCWLRINFLTLNVSKTTFLQFDLDKVKRTNVDVKIHTCGTPCNSDCTCISIIKSTKVKYLGVMVDDRLSWRTHIDYITSRVRKLIWVFKKLRHVSDLNLLRTIYFALVQSVLGYCIRTWGGACKTYIKQLETAQRSLLKVMTFSPYRSPTKTLYGTCKVLSIRKLYILQIIVKHHKNTPYNHEDYIKKRTIRNVCPQIKCRTTTARQQCRYMSTCLYNKINSILNIYPLSTYETKHKVTNFLQALDYDQTELLLLR